MKKLLLLIGIISLMGCAHPKIETAKIDNNIQSEVTTVVIDGCEYLKYPVVHTYAYQTVAHTYIVYHYTHKGNCNNPIHRIK